MNLGDTPLIDGLILSLPRPGAVWPPAERLKWFVAAGAIFDIVYTDPYGGFPSIHIQADATVRLEAKAAGTVVVPQPAQGPAPDEEAVRPAATEGSTSTEVLAPDAGSQKRSRTSGSGEGERPTPGMPENPQALALGHPPTGSTSPAEPAATRVQVEPAASGLSSQPSESRETEAQPSPSGAGAESAPSRGNGGDAGGRDEARSSPRPQPVASPPTLLGAKKLDVGRQIRRALEDAGAVGMRPGELESAIDATPSYVRLVVRDYVYAGILAARGQTVSRRLYLPRFAPIDPASQPVAPSSASSPRVPPAGVADGRDKAIAALNNTQRKALDAIAAHVGLNNWGVARHCGISEKDAPSVVDHLIRCNLVTRDANGRHFIKPWPSPGPR